VILVDSSVWVDFFRARRTPQTDFVQGHFNQSALICADLVIAEVLQGARSESHAATMAGVLGQMPSIMIAGNACAIAAAQNYRKLRALGVTPRKTIDVLIATRCILDSHALLHADKDFDPFEAHLGLKVIHAP
jgi:predicted nucleic acid-binding protein